MKLYGEPISVRLGQNGEPVGLRWRLSLFRVQSVQEEWTYAGKWWTTPQLKGRHRHYYRLQCLNGNGKPVSLEIYCEKDQWSLSRVLD